MRARRREINIFNMSLLDILCGALGAFCFMMLVALPYYIPPGSGLELRKAQEETDRLLVAIEHMKERMPDQKSVEEMEALMKQLEAQVKSLQGRVNMLTSERDEMQTRVKKLLDENDDLRGELSEMDADNLLLKDANGKLTVRNDSLSKENEGLKNALSHMNSFIVIANAFGTVQFIDLLVTSEISDDRNAGPNPGFQQWVKGESVAGKWRKPVAGPGHAMEIKHGAKPGVPYKIFLRIVGNDTTSGQQVTVISSVVDTIGLYPPADMPKVVLTSERPWILIGTVTLDPNNRPVFKEASADERDAEWQTLIGSTPPPTPTPTPPPSAAERAAAEAARTRAREISQKFHALMQTYMLPTTDPDDVVKQADDLLRDMPPSSGMRREVNQMRERALHEKERRKNAPASPAPSRATSTPPPAPVSPTP